MRKQYPIEIKEGRENTVWCPREVIEQQSLEKIAFGACTEEAEFLPTPGDKYIVSISSDLAAKLKLPDLGIPLHLFSEGETLFIGPLVGIFTSGFTPFPLRPIGERTIFFSKLLSVNKAVGALTFLFGEQHIDWDAGTIKGHIYHKEGWATVELPFPNVVYDRLPNRKSERLAELKRIKDRLQKDYLIPWYNPGFFNKLDVFERLQQEEAAVPYLPETHAFSSFSVIERMLGDYGHVYIKPANGSLGLGIRQVIYDREEGFYYCRYRDNEDENRLRKFHTLESLMHHVFRRSNLNSMIVQQGIHLLRHEQRSIDFRVHTNKDESGEWKVTAIAAKVAGLGSVTTHVKNGGEIKTLSEVCTSRMMEQEFTEKLSKAALGLSRVLETQLEGIIAEIGFDLGIDRKGNVWLFEANSKPGRSIFKHPELKEFDYLTRKMSLDFAVFLTEQAISRPEEIFK
ncbi:MAG: YheC/YheD family protein [Bacillota bacterium]